MKRFLATLLANRLTLPRQAIYVGVNALVLGVWLWLYRSVFDYLAIIFTREDFRTNQILLIGVIILSRRFAKKKFIFNLMQRRNSFAPLYFLSSVARSSISSLNVFSISTFITAGGRRRLHQVNHAIRKHRSHLVLRRTGGLE
jgi:hypothetical protein